MHHWDQPRKMVIYLFEIHHEERERKGLKCTKKLGREGGSLRDDNSLSECFRNRKFGIVCRSNSNDDFDAKSDGRQC